MAQQFLTEEQLAEKWSPVLDHADLPAISDSYKKRVTAILLENQQRSIQEEKQMLQEADAALGNVAGNVQKYDPILIGLVRRTAPLMIAYDICGVQPMTGPSGLVFSLRSRYGKDDTSRPEALFNEADTDFSGTGTHGGTDNNPVGANDGLTPWGSVPAYTHGTGMATATAETLTPKEMSFTIDKQTVTATSRALKAEYSIELQQDLKAVHGLDAEAELSNILSTEITAEINREVVRRIYTVAKQGCETGSTAVAGKFDLDVDANGRWSVERFKGLMFHIEREANRIAQTTRRGRGNFLLVSADVASALSMTGLLDSKFGGSQALNVDDSSTTFAGTLNGKYKVYVDPYSANGSAQQFVCVGYKGSSPFDAGMFYCPYVPLQMLRAVDPNTFQPKIGFKTRYGIVGNPMALGTDTAPAGADLGATAAITAKSNNFYRLFQVTNIA